MQPDHWKLFRVIISKRVQIILKKGVFRKDRFIIKKVLSKLYYFIV